MSLHNGIDTVSIATVGVFTKTYGSSGAGNIANLFASFGLFEDAPTLVIIGYLRGAFNMGMNLLMGRKQI